MGKLVKALKKSFLPALIASLSVLTVNTVINGIFAALLSFLSANYITLEPNTLTVYGVILKILRMFIISPFYIGVYRFIFNRIEDKKPNIGSVFEYYRNAKCIIGAFAVRAVYSIAETIAIYLLFFMTSGLYIIHAVLAAAFDMAIKSAICGLWWLAGYEYAKTPKDGAISAVKSSVRRCFKSIKTFGAVFAACVFSYIIGALRDRISLIKFGSAVQGTFFQGLFLYAETFLVMWVSVTIAYLILYKVPAAENTDNENLREGDKEPFYEN